MATLPSLLNSRLFTPFNVPKSALNRNSPPQCSLHSHEPISVSRALETSEQLGRRAGCVLGLGAVAGTMLAFPQHANAADVVDAWSSLVSSEPQNALSLPTWVIHVASVAEWCAFLSFSPREQSILCNKQKPFSLAPHLFASFVFSISQASSS